MQRAPKVKHLVLVAAVLACAPFVRGWLQGEVVFAPLKLLYHFEPWRSLPNAPQPPPWDVLVWDGVAQFYVWRDLIRGAWLGEGALGWNPYALCGTPLLANSQSAPYYLPHILAMLLPTWLAVGVLAYFHLFWAGLGMGLWLRARGVGIGAFVGMGLWMLSLFFVSWLPLSSVPATLSWFGWLLWGLEIVRARGVGLFAAFGLLLGLMLLAGHLQFAFYGVLLSLLYALWLGYETRAQGKLWQYGLAVGLGYLLGGVFASVQVLPALELAGYSHRQSPPTEAGYEAYVRNSLPLFHLITAYFPTAFGDPRAGAYWGAVHYAELALSVGAFGWLLALMGVRRRGQGALWLGVGLLALLIALGTPLTRLLYFYVPGFSATGSPARILCLWAFSVAVLAAYGVQEPRAWRTALGAWLAILAGALLLTLTTLPAGVSRAPLWAGIGASALVLTAVALAVGLAWLGLPRLRNALTPAGWLSLLALAPVVIYALGYPWTAPLRAAFPPLPDLPPLNTGERVAILNTQWSLYEPPPARMPPNTAAMYRLPEIGGYDSLLPRHAKRFLDLLNGQDSAPPENGNMLFVKQVRPELAHLRVRAVLTPDGWIALPPAPVRLQPVEVLPDEESVWARLQANPFPDAIPVWGEEARKAVQEYGAGALVPNAQVVWEEYGDSHLRLRVVNPSTQTAWLLITDTWYPGWCATVNREPVPLLQANGAFRALPIPPGESVVQMNFQPLGMHIRLLSGALIMLLSLLNLVVFLWRSPENKPQLMRPIRYTPRATRRAAMRRSAWLVWLGMLLMNGYSQAKLTLTPLDTTPNPNLIRNASFEAVEGDLPVGWVWDKRNTDSTIQVVAELGATGQRCLKFTNTTPFGADIYGLLRYEGGVSVQPGTVYTLSCRYKTREGYVGFVGGGEGWRVRLPLEDTRGLWRRAEITFATRENETNFDLVIVIEAPTDGVWIDAIKLEQGDRATPFVPAETPERPILTLDNLGEEVYLSEPRGRIEFELYTAQPLRNAEIEVQLGEQRARQPRVNLAAGYTRIAFEYSAPNAPEQTLRLQIRQGRQTLAETERVLRFFTPALAQQRLQALAAQLPTWEAQLQRVRESGQDIAYPQASLTILQEFVRYVGEDLQKGQLQRAYAQLDEMERIAARLNQRLAEALSGAKPLPTVPRYVTSPVEIRGASLIADTVNPLTGERERRPVFFVGFGHFGQVRADLEKLAKMGFNLIQIERGVWDIMPEEGQVNLKPIEEDVLPVLRRAAEANVKVDYLISPHYMPEWVFRKYPHLRQPREGFIQYSLFAPESLTVLREYIGHFAPLLKDQPALLSICLSNEPINKESPDSPLHQQAWRAWLQNRHKNLITLNTRWKTNYKSWDEIPIPTDGSGAPYAEWQQFNAETLANWHRELARAVEQHLPSVPKHAKLMSWSFTNDRELPRGVDPERFAEFCELNGNDAFTLPLWDKDAAWAFDWVTTMLAHEIQRSLRDAPVFNSENHIIRDRETRYVPPQHARAVLWEEAIRGLSATTFWVWERTDDPNSDFAGSLLHRPEIVEALAHTALDLNRLAPYIAALQNQPPDVYILYSQYDMMMQGADAVVPRDSLYIALTMLGVRVGFITERQLEARRLPPNASRLIIANTQFVSDEAFAGLDFLRQQRGLLVLGFGEPSLEFDRYGRKRISRPGTTTFERNPLMDARRLLTRLPPFLGNWGISRPLRLLNENDQPIWGVGYRVAPYEDGYVASLCNYTRAPITVRLVSDANQPITATNLIDGTTVEGTITLQPLEPVLLRWTR